MPASVMETTWLRGGDIQRIYTEVILDLLLFFSIAVAKRRGVHTNDIRGKYL